MRVTQQRVDAWLIKGFDGASSFALERSKQEVELDQMYYMDLCSTISNIEQVLAKRKQVTTEDPDRWLFPVVRKFSEQLLERAASPTIRELGQADFQNLYKYLEILKQAERGFSK